MSPLKSRPKTDKILQLIRYTAKLIYRKYPWYYFPAFLLYQLLIEYKRTMRSKYLLAPIPKRLYDRLIAGEFLKSEHYVFVSDSMFDEFVPVKNLNWINLLINQPVESDSVTISEVGTNQPDIVSSIMSKPNSSILMPVLSVTKCQPNTVFINENCYYNFIEKYKLPERKRILIGLKSFQPDQSLPELATKATIFIINQPNDIPIDVTDEILSRYFESPRILYRNYTYEIHLDEKLLGSHLFTVYFGIFSTFKRLFFRCVHIEREGNQFELQAVVAKGMTNLQQTTSINYFVPRQQLHDLCPIDLYPTGLRKYFHSLSSCIVPFLPVTGTDQSPAPLSTLTIYPTFMLQGDRGCGKTTILTAVANLLGVQMFGVDCAEIVSAIPAQTEAKMKIVLGKADVCQPLIICLYNFEAFGIDNEGREDLRTIAMFQNELEQLFTKERQYPIIFVALTSERQLKPMIQRLFLEIVRIDPPSKEERFEILKWLHWSDIISEEVYGGNLEGIPLFSIGKSSIYLKEYCPDEMIEILTEISDKTQGFLYGDLKLLYDNSRKLMKYRGDPSIDRTHFEENLIIMQGQFSDSLGAPKVPKVLWSDIGGLAKLKDEIQSSIGLPLKHMHLMGKNMRRSGILLYGPPGTGKTLVAKAVATECKLNFLAVQGPELLNMYVGQSEQNVREVFGRARAAAPCVVFLDELDSLAPNRGAAGDSGGVMDRVVSQLLAEMDGMTTDRDPQKQIFILAATNRPDLIDPALLRPGRFDKLLYVGPCTTVDDKSAVLETQIKRFCLEKNLSARSIAELLADDMTGADLYSICSNAWLSAVRRTIHHHKSDNDSPPDSILTADHVIVNMDDFKMAATKFVPSITKKDLEYFNKLKSNFSVG